MNTETLIRPAARADVPLLLELIRELAEYEKLAADVVATEEQLARTLFGETRYAEALVAEVSGEPAGFALFFHNYSTFLARPGLYVEDVFVRPAFRGRGIGRELFRRLAQLAVERGCGRLELWVLDWNEPARRFYRGLGAVPMDEWTVQRIAGEALERLAGSRPAGPG